jgi:glycogen synthase
MRVACVVNQFPPHVTAGLGRYMEEIAPHLAQRCELTVHTINPGELPTGERRGGVTVHRPIGRLERAVARRRALNRTRGPDFLLLALGVVANNVRYLRVLRRSRPDVLAVHDSTNFLAGLLGHHLLRLPVVLHVHTLENGIDAPPGSPLRVFALVERLLGRIARRVVVATPELEERLRRAGWRTPIEVVPLGGTFERVLADPGFDRGGLRARARTLRARLGVATGGLLLLYVGRLEAHKGVFTLVEAMERVRREAPGVRLAVVGAGDADGVRRLAARCGVADRVVLSDGFVEREELMAYYEAADVCVFPSVLEPFGLVATEAMAMGRPTVLGAAFPAVLCSGAEGPTALRVDGGDPAAIAAAVVELARDPELRTTLAARGERHVRTALSWAVAAERTAAVYRGVSVACADRV